MVSGVATRIPSGALLQPRAQHKWFLEDLATSIWLSSNFPMVLSTWKLAPQRPHACPGSQRFPVCSGVSSLDRLLCSSPVVQRLAFCLPARSPSLGKPANFSAAQQAELHLLQRSLNPSLGKRLLFKFVLS